MAKALYVDKLDSDGTIHVTHIFYGETEEECEELRDEHGEGCKMFGPALKQGTTIERFEEIDGLPEWEQGDEEEDPE